MLGNLYDGAFCPLHTIATAPHLSQNAEVLRQDLLWESGSRAHTVYHVGGVSNHQSQLLGSPPYVVEGEVDLAVARFVPVLEDLSNDRYVNLTVSSVRLEATSLLCHGSRRCVSPPSYRFAGRSVCVHWLAGYGRTAGRSPTHSGTRGAESSPRAVAEQGGCPPLGLGQSNAIPRRMLAKGA